MRCTGSPVPPAPRWHLASAAVPALAGLLMGLLTVARPSGVAAQMSIEEQLVVLQEELAAPMTRYCAAVAATAAQPAVTPADDGTPRTQESHELVDAARDVLVKLEPIPTERLSAMRRGLPGCDARTLLPALLSAEAAYFAGAHAEGCSGARLLFDAVRRADIAIGIQDQPLAHEIVLRAALDALSCEPGLWPRLTPVFDREAAALPARLARLPSPEAFRLRELLLAKILFGGARVTNDLPALTRLALAACEPPGAPSDAAASARAASVRFICGELASGAPLVAMAHVESAERVLARDPLTIDDVRRADGHLRQAIAATPAPAARARLRDRRLGLLRGDYAASLGPDDFVLGEIQAELDSLLRDDPTRTGQTVGLYNDVLHARLAHLDRATAQGPSRAGAKLALLRAAQVPLAPRLLREELALASQQGESALAERAWDTYARLRREPDLLTEACACGLLDALVHILSESSFPYQAESVKRFAGEACTGARTQTEEEEP